MSSDKILCWMGRPVEELDRKELLEAVHELARMWNQSSEELRRLSPHVDWLSYLSTPRKPT